MYQYSLIIFKHNFIFNNEKWRQLWQWQWCILWFTCRVMFRMYSGNIMREHLFSGVFSIYWLSFFHLLHSGFHPLMKMDELTFMMKIVQNLCGNYLTCQLPLSLRYNIFTINLHLIAFFYFLMRMFCFVLIWLIHFLVFIY